MSGGAEVRHSHSKSRGDLARPGAVELSHQRTTKIKKARLPEELNMPFRILRLLVYQITIMAGIIPRRNSTPSSFEALQPRTSTSLRRSGGGVYAHSSASGSVPSFVDSVPTLGGSEVNLFAQRNLDATVELPPLAPRQCHRPISPNRPIPPNRPISPNRPGTPDPAIPIEERPQEADDRPQEAEELPPMKEWKSWRIQYPWMSFLLVVTISLIATIITLDIVSRKNNGFAPLASAPRFLARDPAIERAIWAQGILYTSFPALIMTLYRTMWESTITAFADRQPYVDLRKRGGRPAKSTIMLDYKTEPALWAFVLAFQTKHYLLGLCLLTSVLLALLVVPLVAFLFTTASFSSNTILPVLMITTFDDLSVLPDLPDLRLSLNSAAAMRLQDAHGPPWTDGEFAFPKFIPSIRVGDGNVAIETVAYSADIDCEYLPESDYTKVVVPPGTPGFPTRATTFQITANHRGCEIEGEISINTIPDLPDFPGMPSWNPPQTELEVWSTRTCSVDSGWTRLSMLTARYVNSSTGITNFSLISCIPSYRMTPGTLVATTSASSEPSFKSFTPQRSNMTTFRSAGLGQFFEMNMPIFNCFDQLSKVRADEFMRGVYNIASRRHPGSPLMSEALIEAASTLWSTTFAVLASTALFRPEIPSLNGTGSYSAEVNSLVVVSPIAYIILSVLIVVALLNISLFFYASEKSILVEEPVGLVSAAGILHGSSVNEIVADLVRVPEFDGRVTAAMKRDDELMVDRYRFDEEQRRIVHYEGEAVPRRNWWRSFIEWMGDMIYSNTLLDKFRTH